MFARDNPVSSLEYLSTCPALLSSQILYSTRPGIIDYTYIRTPKWLSNTEDVIFDSYYYDYDTDAESLE